VDKFFTGIIKHYYWFLTAIAASLMFGVRDVSSLFILISVFVCIRCLPNIKWNLFDGFVFVYILYCLCSYFVATYAYTPRLYYLGVRAEIVPILFYFMARSKQFQSDDFFENIRNPLVVAMLFGVYFYFFMPSYYMSYKMSVVWTTLNARVSDLSGHLLYEMTRLSSFWPHSYFIGYSSLFLFMFMMKKIVVDDVYGKKDLFALFLSFFCLFFSQQRVSIAFCLLFFAGLTGYATLKKLKTRMILYALWFIAIVGGIGIFLLVTTFLDVDFVDYILNRSVNYKGNMVGDRFDMFSFFTERLSLFGDGLGRYGHGANELGYKSIPDCDYIRIPAQFGFFGMGMLMTICFVSIYTGVRIFKFAFFEVCCLCFCLVAMLGAAPWELGTLQPFMYWFCIGHIQSKFERRDSLEQEFAEYAKKYRSRKSEDQEETDEVD